ncbi:MAG: Uma2 family endonuclease [Caldilineaceae bacterium]
MSMQPVVQPGALSPIGQPGWPQQGQWTYADYLSLPDDGKRYEIIKGVLYSANAPSYEHQYTVGEVSFALRLSVKQHQAGVILEAPFEVHLAENIKPVQPDVLFIRAEQQPSAGTQVFAGVPDLIVEVISPSSIRLDRTVKFDTYEQAGVPEYWIIDLKAHLVEVYTLARGEYALFGQYTGDELSTSQVLSGLQIKASTLFLPG